MIKSFNPWLRSLIVTALEEHFYDGVTREALIDFINFTVTEKQWCEIFEFSRKKMIREQITFLIGKEIVSSSFIRRGIYKNKVETLSLIQK